MSSQHSCSVQPEGGGRDSDSAVRMHALAFILQSPWWASNLDRAAPSAHLPTPARFEMIVHRCCLTWQFNHCPGWSVSPSPPNIGTFSTTGGKLQFWGFCSVCATLSKGQEEFLSLQRQRAPLPCVYRHVLFLGICDESRRRAFEWPSGGPAMSQTAEI